MQVLIVESALGPLARLLRVHGHEVTTAADGAEALRLARRVRPQVLLADCVLPVMGCPQLCRAVRSDDRLDFVYVIVLATLSQNCQAAEAMDAGADDVLRKPVDADDLLGKLRVVERIVRVQARHEALTAELKQLQDAVAAAKGVPGVLAHELRTPLAAVRGMAEFLLTNEARDVAELDLFLRNIHDEVVRLAATVDEILEAARVGSGRAAWCWSQFSLERICHEALDSVRLLVDRGRVDVECHVEPARAAVWGDEGAVRRLVLNLARNAQKHTTRGSIRINARRYTDQTGGWAEIRISDTGSGIRPELADRLGEAFALNASAVGSDHIEHGTGLGLAICKSITAAHGGSLRIESGQGQGTTVTALLRADLHGPVATEGGQIALAFASAGDSVGPA